MKFAKKAKPEQPRENEHHADKHREGGGRDEEASGIAIRHRKPELRAGENPERGGGADAEHARRAQAGVDQDGKKRGVEAGGHREAGHGSVGHRLREHDGRGGEPGDEVEPQRRANGVGNGRYRGALHRVTAGIRNVQ
jgi:hypothetical protein